MSNDQSLNEFKKIVQRITEAETNDFFELAAMLGRNPKTDLAGANLNDVNLSGGDLRGANLRKTSLRGADLTETDLSGADLSCADLTYANLTRSNLSLTNFKGARLKDALFRNNQGISDSIKSDLIEKGAIFEEEEELDINIQAFQNEIQELLERYRGEYVGYVGGRLVAHDQDRNRLSERLNLKYTNEQKYIQYIKEVDEKEEIQDISNIYN